VIAGTDKPLRADAQRNRERIQAAALELFAERGVEVTLDDIAERAGVGVGTVYRRFPNKDVLLDELFEARIAELAAHAEAALAERDAWKAFVGFLENVAEGFSQNRALSTLILQTDRGQEHVARARERIAPAVYALIERAQAEGGLRDDFDQADTRMILGMLAAVAEETHETSPDLWRRYFVFIADGLAAKRSAPTQTDVPPPKRRPAKKG
jgi:AcrR family transcriptional regulator